MFAVRLDYLLGGFSSRGAQLLKYVVRRAFEVGQIVDAARMKGYREGSHMALQRRRIDADLARLDPLH